MGVESLSDTWERGSPYERYIGRWSRQVAPLFLAWLDAPARLRWLDVGCGTGALCAAILDACDPADVIGVEPSEGFLALAAQNLHGRARFVAGNAAAVPLDDHGRDIVVSGLVLNFVPDLPAALAELRRVTAPGGTIAAYVWDYGDGMEVIRHFWDAAIALDPAAASLHEATRFPGCDPVSLQQAFAAAGLAGVATTALDVTARFAAFDDYWQPFLGGQGPAPAYAMALPQARREALRARLDATLPRGDDGTIRLRARAWAVRGTHVVQEVSP